MENTPSKYFLRYEDYSGPVEEKAYKATLAYSENMLVGITRLGPGQSQPVHIHVGEDKVYIVLDGCGYFQVGNEYRNVEKDTMVWAPAALPHSVINNSPEDLVLLFVISPSPAQ